MLLLELLLANNIVCSVANSPIKISSPIDGDSVISPLVVYLSLNSELIDTTTSLDGYSVCLQTKLDHMDNIKCVDLNLKGETMLPEIDANVGISDISAWLKDEFGHTIGAPHVVPVNVMSTRASGMFEASSMALNNEWFSDKDNQAFKYSQNACASSNSLRRLNFLIFSNSSNFRTARAMVHYADGLINAGCGAHIGFIRATDSGETGLSKEDKEETSDLFQAKDKIGQVGKRYFTTWEDLVDKSVEYDTILFEKVSSCESDVCFVLN